MTRATMVPSLPPGRSYFGRLAPSCLCCAVTAAKATQGQHDLTNAPARSLPPASRGMIASVRLGQATLPTGIYPTHDGNIAIRNGQLHQQSGFPKEFLNV